jgi:lipopolysaccharide heptosyltransferase II
VIFRLVGLGDLLMLTPAIREYKKIFPLEKLILIVGKSNQHVFKDNPYIEQVIGIDDAAIYSGRLLRLLSEVRRLIGILKKIKPYKIYILQRDWRWNVVALLAGIRKRHGFYRHVHSLFLTTVVATTDKEHEIDKYFKLFDLPCSTQTDRCQLDIFAGQEDVKKGIALANKFPSNNLIAVSPGGALNTKGEWKLKRWPLDYYKSLISQLVKDGYTIVLIGGSQDKRFTKQICDQIGREQIVDLAGKYSIQETYSILKRCLLMVTHDSGPMHIAAAAGIPVISMFGPTSPYETRPLTKGSYFFWKGDKISCAPCYRFGKMPDCKTGECLKTITPDKVYAKISRLLVSRSFIN